MSTLFDYTKDIDVLQEALLNEEDPYRREFIQMQIEFATSLLALKLDFTKDAMDMAKEAIEDRLVQERKGNS